MARRLWILMIAPLVALSIWASCKSVPFTAPTGATISISANPTTIPVTGGSSTITVTIIEMSGTPVPDETVVTFTSTLGTITPEAKTKRGIAKATLSAAGQGGTATVTAFSGAGGTATTDVTIGATGASITLTASPASLPTGGGTVKLSSTVFGSGGAPIPGASVVFSTTQGTLASQGRPVTADSNGQATDELSTTRSADVTVTSGSQTKTLTISVGTTGITSIVLSASQVNLPAGGGSTGLTAVVFGASGPVANVAVAWSASAGTLATPGVTLTNAMGVATNSLSTGVASTVTAVAGGSTASLMVTVGATTAANIAVSASRSSIPSGPAPVGDCSAPNVVPVTLFAQVTDDNGLPLANREVTFYVDFTELSDCARAFGEFCGGGTTASAVTDGNGVARVLYNATQADFNFCNCLPSGCNCFPNTVPCIESTPTPVPTPTPTPPTPTPPPPTPTPMGRGYCPNNGATCSTLPTCRTTPSSEDLFCQAPIKAVSGGVTSVNVQFLEYGK